MATISCTAGVLTNVWIDTPASRFSGFAPRARVIGQRRTLLGTGAPRVWAYRSDHTARFAVKDIANTDLALCLAISLHLQNEGVVVVTTGDTLGSTYTNCVLAPGADPPDPTLSDAQALRYSMEFDLLNLDGTPFVAVY